MVGTAIGRSSQHIRRDRRRLAEDRRRPGGGGTPISLRFASQFMSFSRDQLRAAYEEACRREIEALKPGNVHVFADGHRMSADQFVTSAEVSSGPLTDPALSVGRRILEAVRATRKAVDTNTNLGIVLLCAPLIRAAEM